MLDALHLLQAAADTTGAYRDFPLIGSRQAIWIAAEIHLMFAAFVLGVPIFAVVAEAIGIFGKDQRYDRLSKEFTRLLLIAYSATAIWGAVFVFLLSTLRSEEHTSELQSRLHLVCRLLLEKKKTLRAEPH